MTNLEVAFHDSVLHDIENFIAAHPPERGGALMGPVGQPVVSRFVADPHAAVTGVTYTPSEVLRQRVAQTERADANLELKGIVHSHPRGVDAPSSGDHRAFADQLGKAPWLGRMICPIVTSHDRQRLVGEHRVPLVSGTMSVYVAEARARGGVKVAAARPRVIPIGRDVAVLARCLEARPQSSDTFAVIDGVLYAAVSLTAAGADVTALFPPLYPTVPPLVLVTPGGRGRLAEIARDLSPASATVALPMAWSLNIDERERLSSALGGVISGRAARSATHPGVPADAPESDGSADTARSGLRARLDGAAAATLGASRVLIVGLGSGGSQTAEALARASVEHFTVIDPDHVSPENLSRSVYRLADVGREKTAALADHLRAINPAVTVDTRTATLSDIPGDELTELIRGSDLVIAATDDPKAQLDLNHRAWANGIPAVFGGVYARGRAGEVIFTVPGITRCYRCAAANRGLSRQDSAAINYGTGQLVAEPALGADIGHVVTASVKIGIGLLELGSGGADHAAGELVASALAQGYQFLILSTVSNYDFFPTVFKDAAAQHGYQSVWMSVQGDPACPTCGTSPMAADAHITGAPDLTALRPDGDAGDSTDAAMTPMVAQDLRAVTAVLDVSRDSDGTARGSVPVESADTVESMESVEGIPSGQ